MVLDDDEWKDIALKYFKYLIICENNQIRHRLDLDVLFYRFSIFVESLDVFLDDVRWE